MNIMDFNVKKLAADAGTFLSRAVQVPRWGKGGGAAGTQEGQPGARPEAAAPPSLSCPRTPGLLRPQSRLVGAAWCPSELGGRCLSRSCPTAAAPEAG